EPKSVVGVPVSQSDLNYLSQACSGLNLEECMGAYGTFVWTTPPQPKEFQTRGQASAEAGFAVQTPTSLPSSVTGNPRYGVINRSSATFTFSADSTRQAAARQNRTAPPLPADIDGSKLFITGGPAAVQIWGAPAGATGATGAYPDVPTLIVGQAKAPTISSDGVTVEELRSYLLSQPGISPQLAAAIRANGAIRLEHVTKRYAKVVALDDLSLSVEHGVFGFLGPNGAGKTTAVKILLGLTRPTSGSGSLAGAALGSKTSLGRIGYLPELFRYQSWLTAREVLALHCELAAIPRAKWASEIDRILATVGLADRGT